MKKTRFDLEDAILSVQGTVKDLDLFIMTVMDGPKQLSEDEIYNLAMGIRSVLDMRSNALWDTFKQVFELDEYSPYGLSGKPDVDLFWNHLCPQEGMMGVRKGDECPWCGEKE